MNYNDNSAAKLNLKPVIPCMSALQTVKARAWTLSKGDGWAVGSNLYLNDKSNNV
jgi:hypothetical protein